MKIAILGAGPVGMVAAHAVALYGHTPAIYGIDKPSSIRGAQYLHAQIDDLTDDKPEGMVTYRKVGTREGYAQKVYGDPAAPCSWDRWEGDYPAWSLGRAYTKLWELYEASIFDMEIRYNDITLLKDEYSLIFSSINPLGYCQHHESGDHEFAWQQIKAIEKAEGCEQNEIIYNGDLEIPWYRSSLLFDIASTEYAQKTREWGSLVRKPLTTSCDCHVDSGFERIGRYGKFEKNLLVTDAWERCLAVLDEV